MTVSKQGAVHYIAPELLKPAPAGAQKRYIPSKESDVYSLAVTAFKVLTGVLPHDGQRETVIAYLIVSGERPLRPRNPIADRWLPDSVWEIIQRCWDQTPHSRFRVDSLHQAFAESKGTGPVDVDDTISPTCSEPPATVETTPTEVEQPPTETDLEVPRRTWQLPLFSILSACLALASIVCYYIIT